MRGAAGPVVYGEARSTAARGEVVVCCMVDVSEGSDQVFMCQSLLVFVVGGWLHGSIGPLDQRMIA